MREIGPFVDGYSLFWAVEGRGRKSVTLDLRTPEGQDSSAAARGDGRRRRRELPAGHARAVEHRAGPASPDRLVTVRISMFGQDGPYSARPGLDRVGIGYGGLLHLTGYPDRPPVRVGVTISDYLTGVFAAHAAVAALYARDARGAGGAVIDAALYGSVLRILEWTLPAYDRLGTVRSREGNRLANSAPLDNYPTRDEKFVCIVAGSDANFGRLCKAMDRPDLLDDPKFARLADRAAHGDEINGIVADWTSTLDARAVEERCVAHDVPVATAYTSADIFADPHFAARNDLVTVDDPVIGPVRQQAPYPRHVGETPTAPAGAPRLGEHTDEVLAALLDLSAAEIDALHTKGIV